MAIKFEETKAPGVLIAELPIFKDNRGTTAELFREDWGIDYKPSMVYVSSTKPKVMRGPHEHHKQSDCFAFIGPGEFKVYLWWKDSEGKVEKWSFIAGESRPILLIVPPGVVHAYKNVGNSTGICLNMPNTLYKGVNYSEPVDEIRWENHPQNPYR